MLLMQKGQSDIHILFLIKKPLCRLLNVAFWKLPTLIPHQPIKTSRTTSPPITIRERRRACRSTNKVQLCMGGYIFYTSPSNHTDPSQGLIKSTTRQDQQEGVRLLSDIFRTAPERRRECLYYLALGNYKLGNYAEARRYNDLLLDKEPANMQAASLRGLIDDKVAREGLMGVAILSGVAIAAGVVGGMIFKSVGRRAR